MRCMLMLTPVRFCKGRAALRGEFELSVCVLWLSVERMNMCAEHPPKPPRQYSSAQPRRFGRLRVKRAAGASCEVNQAFEII